MQLNVSFERYTDKIAAANTQALTEALQPGIQELNTRVQTTAGLPMCVASVQSYHQQLASLLSKTIETAHRDPGSHLSRAAEDSGKHVVALDRALEDELTRSIESFGRQLPASLQRSGPLMTGLMVIFLLIALSDMMWVAAQRLKSFAPRSIML